MDEVFQFFKFINTIFTSLTFWFLVAMLNGLMSGSVISFFSTEFNYWPSTIFLVFIFTLLFTIPGIFIFWLVLLANWETADVFRTLLKTGFVISIIASLLVYILPVGMGKAELLFLPLCIVIAATASIMIHHSILKSITANNKNERKRISKILNTISSIIRIKKCFFSSRSRMPNMVFSMFLKYRYRKIDSG